MGAPATRYDPAISEDPAIETEPGAAAAPRRVSLRRAWVLGALLALALGAARPAVADEHDPQRTGHPLRILAYAVHPIGVALDYLLMRPAHWVVNREPFRTIFGHED